MPTQLSHQRPRIFAFWLIVAGVIGWIAAFALIIEKLHKLEFPDQTTSCYFSVLVQCDKNLGSAQGAVFGFPNPIIGLACWVAPIVVGFAILAGARFARWFWWLFWLGHAFAITLVIWLICQSIFVLHTLCPWCMVTWAVTIPTFYAVTVHLLRSGAVPVGAKVRAVAERLMTWVPLMAFVSYVIVAVIAQLQLNWMASL